jgi:lipopolysaccharide transport system permease protein
MTSFFKGLRILFSSRELLLAWTQREISIRYKQSVLGGLWAVIQPFSMMLIFSVVFSRFVRVQTDGIPYPIFSYSALLPWTLLTTSINFAVPSLVNNLNLVTKIYFPREILPIASVGAAFLDFLIASIIFIGMLWFYKIPLKITMLWLPVLLLIQVTLILGIVLLMSALLVFFRDIRFVIPLLTQLWMYATPIIYPLKLVPENLLSFYVLNPMVGLIESYRRITLLGQPPEWNYVSISAVIAIIMFVIGYAYFKRSEGKFADLI